MSDNWFYDYFINEVKNITRPCSGGSVPKPLTYDYMPEGYPSKAVQTTTLMAEQEVAFTLSNGLYMAQLSNTFKIVDGQTYAVNWDGTEYECVCSLVNGKIPILGNLSIMGEGSDTGEPFIYVYNIEQAIGMFATPDTSATHTISVKTVTEVITPMTYDYMPEGYPKKRGRSIEWDGNTEGLVAVEVGSIIFCKVSDLTPTDDELIGSTIELSNGEKAEITSDMLGATSEDIIFLESIAVVKKDNATVEGLTFPQKGTYFAKEQKGQTFKAAQPKPLYVQKLTEAITPMAMEFMPPKIVEAIDAVNNAQSTANNALSTANNAQATANNNRETLNGTFNSVATFTFDKQTSGKDTFVFNAFNYYKISDFNPAPKDVISFKGTKENGNEFSVVTTGNNCAQYGLFIVVASAGNCSIPITETTSFSFTASSAGLYARYEKGKPSMTAGTGEFTLRWPIEILLRSSQSYNTKQFKIAIDDSGIIKIINTSDGTEAQLTQTDEHINELINSALSRIGVAEDGAY